MLEVSRKKPTSAPASTQAIDRDRLYDARTRRKMTQLQLAVAAGMQPPEISMLEAGKGPDVKGSTLRRLALALDCSTDYLLGLGPKIR